jgi:hypothetical protein
LTKSSSAAQGGVSPTNWEKGSSLLNHIGYAALLISVIDYGAIVVPFRFTNPNWEFEVIKQLINQVVVLLVAFGLVFYRPMTITRKFTKHFLRFLSWLCLLIGVFYLLLLPLAMVDIGKIGLIQQNNVNDRLNQQLKVSDAVNKQVSRSGITEPELQGWAREVQLTPQLLAKDRAANISLKDSILTRLKTLKEAAQTQAKQTLESAQKQNLKDTISIISRGLISGVAFIWMWYLTGWARRRISKKPRRRKSLSNQATQLEQTMDSEQELEEQEVEESSHMS